MDIRGFIPTSIIEWPGKISGIIFTAGCNFRCPFCHNRDLVDPKRITRLQEYSEQSIFEDLKKRKKWVDAVVITGGEPTIQPRLEEFLRKIKEMGFLTMIETNGSKPEMMAKLLNCKIVDRVAMDIKGPLNAQYALITNFQLPLRQVSGQAVFKIKESIKLIIDSGVDFEFRTTVVPGIHNQKNLQEMIEQLRRIIEEQKNRKIEKINWVLQNFRPNNCLDPKCNKVRQFKEKEMESFLVSVRKLIPQASLR